MNSFSLSGKAIRLSLAVATLSAAAMASADTTSTSFNIGLTNTDWTSNQTLNRFDSSLGTLISATYMLSSHVDTEVIFGNMSSSSTPNHVIANVDGKIDFSAGLGSLGGHATTSLDAFVPATTELSPMSASADWTTGYITISDPALLALLTGTSPLNITVTATDLSTSTDDNGNGYALFTTLASAHGEIVYTYRANPTSSVPGPSAAIAFLGTAIVRRRKARNAK